MGEKNRLDTNTYVKIHSCKRAPKTLDRKLVWTTFGEIII